MSITAIEGRDQLRREKPNLYARIFGSTHEEETAGLRWLLTRQGDVVPLHLVAERRYGHLEQVLEQFPVKA